MRQRRKSQLYRLLILIFVTFAVTSGLITIREVTPVYAAEEIMNENRLNCLTTDIYINQMDYVFVDCKERKDKETLIVTSSNTSIVKANLGKWLEGRARVFFTPVSEGDAIVTVTTEDGKNQIEINVHTYERKEMDATKLYKKCSAAMVELTTYDSIQQMNIGSGFFIGKHYIVTNYHVIQEANLIEVRDYQGNQYTVTKMVDYNTVFDLAVLEVEEGAASVLLRNKNKLLTGETVYSIGSPLSFTGSISEGIISFAYRYTDNAYYIQHTASISKSSGGGALLNSYGEVIGVNAKMLTSGQDIYFAVNTDYLERLDYGHPVDIEEFYKENKDKVKMNEIYINISQ